jgi:hypothetical protein
MKILEGEGRGRLNLVYLWIPHSIAARVKIGLKI